MNKENKYFYQVILIIGISFVLMLAYQGCYSYFPFFKKNYKNFAFFKGYTNSTKPKKYKATKNLLAQTEETLPLQENFSNTKDSLHYIKILRENSHVDSLLLKDSVHKEIQNNLKSITKIDEIEQYNWDHLFPFYKAVDQLQKGRRKKIRIAYFGDSMIEGDLIVSILREKLQNKMGGEGVGYVPITSNVAGFRRTVIHRFSENWEQENMLLQIKSHKHPFGISGYNHQIADSTNAWVSWKGTSEYSHLNQFSQMQLFYSCADSIANSKEPIKITYNNSITRQKTLQQKGILQSLHLKQENTHQIKIDIPASYRNYTFYGISLESDKGVYVDNLPLRGSSGSLLQYLRSNLLTKVQKERPYDLVILQYGTNVCDTAIHSFNWYRHKLSKSIQHIKKNWNNVPCLVVSLADKAIKIDGEMQTSPAVAHVLKAQYQASKIAKTSFFNLYKSMGGKGSMIEWADAKKSLANKDYTHLNFRGARKVGNMLFDYLEDGYKIYEDRTTQGNLPVFVPKSKTVSVKLSDEENRIELISK